VTFAIAFAFLPVVNVPNPVGQVRDAALLGLYAPALVDLG